MSVLLLEPKRDRARSFTNTVDRYEEGIEILYEANRLAIYSEPLLLNLPRLIIPQRLQAIKSLELNIKAHIDSPRPGEFNVDLSHLDTILDTLTNHCHGLRHLHLSLECPIYASPGRVPISSILQKIDTFFRPSKILDMTLELPSTTYRSCLDMAVSNLVEHPLEEKQPRFAWRCFDVHGKEAGGPRTEMRSAGNYPKPPLQLPTAENETRSTGSRGYWILEGNYDRPNNVVYCFGSTAMS